MSRQFTKAKSFDASTISYQKAVVNKRGGKSVQIQLNGEPLVLQIPLMLNWGLNERVAEDSGRVSYDMSLQFNDSSPAILRFMESMRDLQEKIVEDSCGEKCKEWMGKPKMSTEVAKALMYPILKYPQKKDAQGNPTGEPDEDRYPSMKIKIPFWQNKFLIELYGMDKKPLYLANDENHQGVSPVDAIPKASHIKGLIQCTGIWFAGGKFGVTWKLVQACVRPPVRLLGSGTCQIADDSDDEDMDNTLTSREEKSSDQEQVSKPSFDVDDDDDDVDEMDNEEDEEDEPEVEPEPEPAPKPKKKKVVRRKKRSGGD